MIDIAFKPKRRTLIAAAFSALVLAATGTLADDDSGKDRDDGETAYQATKDGRILPLADILARIKLPPGSEVVEIELEDKGGLPVYEIYYIDPGGRRHEIKVDARSGAALNGIG